MLFAPKLNSHMLSFLKGHQGIYQITTTSRPPHLHPSPQTTIPPTHYQPPPPPPPLPLQTNSTILNPRVYQIISPSFISQTPLKPSPQSHNPSSPHFEYSGYTPPAPSSEEQCHRDELGPGGCSRRIRDRRRGCGRGNNCERER